MKLTSAIYRVTAIKKATKAKLFADIREGDLLRFSMELGDPGRGRGLYASYVTVENLTQGTSDDSKSQSQVAPLLANFELAEVSGGEAAA